MIGEIPAGWSIKTVADICDKPQYGLTASANSSSDVGPKFLRITDITQSGVNWNKVPYCEYQIDQIDKFRLYNNDILFARIGGTTGKSFIVKNPPQSVFASYLIRLRVLSEKDNPYYLYFYFQSPFYWQQINANKDNNLKGGVNASVLSKLQIISPPLKEQQKIAAVLFKIQQAIGVQEAIIEAAQELKKSTMQQVFTYGLRGEKTKETEIGRVPESWGIKLLGNLVKVKGGKRLPRGKQLLEEETHYPYIRVCDLKNNSVAMDQLMYVPVDVQPQIKKYVINSKDIYISIAGTTGLVGIIPSELDGAQLTENAARLVLLSDPPDQKYLMRFLNSSYGQSQIESMTMKTSQPKLSLSRIKQIKIVLPPNREQIEIASVLQSIDNKIVLHSAKKYILQDIFKTTLNKLMTGEIRVKDSDIDTSCVLEMENRG